MPKQPDHLKIAEGLALPLDAATRRMAILAMSGAGKSNLAVVLAECMHEAGIPWVAIDPKGDWWGVRSNCLGTGPGLPVPIFGGLHGDLPLVPGSGRLVADLIVDQRLTCVLDVSEFDTRQAMWGFLIDLGEQLLHRNRDALHVFLEEADELLPQKASERGNLPKCLGTWQRVVKRGRFRGIGTTQITQRSAALNKDTLYQAEALFALRVTGKGDRKAIEGWVEHHQAGVELVASLPTLADGEGWITSPAWLKTTRRVHFLRRATYDSGATPVQLDKGRKPATLADIDLDALRVSMADTIDRAKADDPVELKKKLAAAERRIQELERRGPVHVDHDVPVLSEEQTDLLRRIVVDLDGAREAIGHSCDAFGILRGTIDGHLHNLARVAEERRKAEPGTSPWPGLTAKNVGAIARGAPLDFGHSAKAKPIGRFTGAERKGDALVVKGELNKLPPVQDRILFALYELHAIGVEEPPRIQVVFFSGYSHPNSKGFTNSVGALCSSGLVVYPSPGKIALTSSGMARVVALGAPARPSSATELHDRIRALLAPVDWRVLEPILRAYPSRIRREDLIEAAGYSHPNSKGFTNTLGRLRSLGLIDYPEPGYVRALPVLFLEAA